MMILMNAARQSSTLEFVEVECRIGIENTCLLFYILCFMTVLVGINLLAGASLKFASESTGFSFLPILCSK